MAGAADWAQRRHHHDTGCARSSACAQGAPRGSGAAADGAGRARHHHRVQVRVARRAAAAMRAATAASGHVRGCVCRAMLRGTCHAGTRARWRRNTVLRTAQTASLPRRRCLHHRGPQSLPLRLPRRRLRALHQLLPCPPCPHIWRRRLRRLPPRTAPLPLQRALPALGTLMLLSPRSASRPRPLPMRWQRRCRCRNSRSRCGRTRTRLPRCRRRRRRCSPLTAAPRRRVARRPGLRGACRRALELQRSRRRRALEVRRHPLPKRRMCRRTCGDDARARKRCRTRVLLILWLLLSPSRKQEEFPQPFASSARAGRQQLCCHAVFITKCACHVVVVVSSRSS